MFTDDVRTNRTLKNIRKSLEDNLKIKYNIEDKDIIDNILKIHGLHKDNFDFVSNIAKIINERLNDISIDANSNKNEKTIEGINQEVMASTKKLVGFDYLYRVMKDNYGQEEAKRLVGEMLDLSIGISDSTQLMKPYCYAIDASKLITIGRPFGQLQSKGAKRVSSYISSLCETVHQLSNHLAGACAVGTFFLDIAHLCIYKHKYSLFQLRDDNNLRKQIENEFQQFVHSVNHLSRNANESPFTNISIFDREKIKTLINDDNFGWYFEKNEILNELIFQEQNHLLAKDISNEKINEEQFITEYIITLQDLFLDFFDKGDPLQGGMPYRFPVCFKGSELIIVNDSLIDLQSFIKNEGWRDVSDKNFYTEYEGTPVKIMKTYKGLSKNFVKIKSKNGVGKDIIVTPEHKFPTNKGLVAAKDLKKGDRICFYKKELKNSFTSFIKVEEFLKEEEKTRRRHQNRKDSFIVHSAIPFEEELPVEVYNIEVNNEEHLFTLPCGVNTSNCTVNISKKENGEIKILDKKFLHDICKRDIYRYNIFTSEGTKTASCCRLINNSEMLELASQSNSFGGASVSLGSHRVVTINMNRIALECESEENYYEILNNRLESTAKVLKSHKDLIKTLTDKGLQYFVKSGWIQLNRLFSTFGILGVYEANETLRKRFNIDNNKDLIGEILIFFNNKVNQLSKEYNIIGNIEAIPGESFAVRLCDVDKIIYNKEKVNYELYSNQFVPLWEDSTIWERMAIDGKYNKLITGGGIVHCMIGEKVTASQAEKIIKYSIESGCEHFALNAVYSKCIKGHVSFGKKEICSICGEHIEDMFTRVVGFFVPVSSWNKTRREWEFPKRTFVLKENIKSSDNQ